MIVVSEHSKKILRIASLAALFVVSFCFFLYVTFPYEVLKEVLTSEISKATGYTVQVDKLEPRFLFKMQAKDLSVEPPRGGFSVQFSNVEAGVRLLPLFIGRLGLIAVARTKDGGTLSVSTSLSLFKLLGSIKKSSDIIIDVLSKLDIEAKNFPIDGLTRLAFSTLSSLPSMNPLVAPLLEKVGFNGKLTATVDLGLDTKDFAKSSGNIDIHLANAVLKLSDPSVGLPDQVFSKALIKASLGTGTMTFDPSSGFTAPELDFGLKGKIALKPTIEASLLDLSMALKLEKTLQSQFGFVVDAMAGSTRGGNVTIQLRGPVNSPTVTYL